jgi:hypothetical protein
MNRDEIHDALESRQELGLVLHSIQLASGIKLKRFIAICKKSPDRTGRYSWHYLQENPSYVWEQEIIQSKPYLVYLSSVSDAPELMDQVNVYFASLDEVDMFLRQFNKSLTDFQKLSDTEYLL